MADGYLAKKLKCGAGSVPMTNHWLRGNGDHFSHVPKCSLKQFKLGQRSVKVKGRQNSKVTGVEILGPPSHQTDEMPPRPAYLPLQHQLFGEQHGLVAERLCHQHSSVRIPGAAWTFDTCGRQSGESEVRAAANHPGSSGPGKAPALSGFQKLKRSFTDTCGHRSKKVRAKVVCRPISQSYSSPASTYNWHHGEGTWRDGEKRTTAVLFVGLLQEQFPNRETHFLTLLHG